MSPDSYEWVLAGGGARIRERAGSFFIWVKDVL